MTGWTGTRRRAVVAVGMVAGLVAAIGLVGCQLPGAQFVVTTTTDGPDAAPGDGVCEVTPGVGDCSLRAAVMEANAEPGSNDIEIGTGRTYQLTTIGPNEDAAAAGDLDITDTVSINGASTIDGTHHDRVFDVLAGNVFIDGATIQNGGRNQVAIAMGGGIHVGPAASLTLTGVTVQTSRAVLGAGIANEGRLAVASSRIVNDVVDGSGPAVVAGGGIFTSGPLSVDRSTIRADDGREIGDSIFAVNATVDVEGTLIDGQIRAGDPSGHPNDGSTVTVRNSTLTGRGAAVRGGHFAITASTLVDDSTDPRAEGTVFGPGTVADVGGSALQSARAVCSGPGQVGNTDEDGQPAPAVTSTGFNVANDSSCGLAAAGDRQGVRILVGLRADNGGPTLTRLPYANSPLVGAIPSPTPGLCEPGDTDQRGQPRDAHGSCDAGAVEGASAQPANPLHLVVTTTTDAADDSQPGNGRCDGGPSGCSLRAAIDEANTWPAADEISFAPGINPLVSTEPQLIDDLTIDGNGATTISPDPNAFFVNPLLFQVHGSLVVNRVTLSSTVGGLIGGEGTSLRIVDSTLVGAAGSVAVGVEGPTSVESSTFTGDPAVALSVGADSAITDSTFVGSSSTSAFSGSITAGNALNPPCSSPPTITVTIVSSTMTGNSRDLRMGCGARAVIIGSILDSGFAGLMCGSDANVTSVAYNRIAGADPSCAGPGDAPTTAVQLGPLANHGGPTQTILQLAGSSTLDRIPVGTPAVCVTGSTDQRHVARPIGAKCDIGATEGTAVVP